MTKEHIRANLRGILLEEVMMPAGSAFFMNINKSYVDNMIERMVDFVDDMAEGYEERLDNLHPSVR